MKNKIFPSAQEAIITISILSFLSGACLGVFLLLSKLYWVEFISSLATLVATFSGAWLAFYLANRERVRKERSQKVMYLNKALFVLIRQLNAIEGIGRYVDKYSEDESLAFEMPGYKSNEYNDLKIDFDSLAFLASTEYVNELLKLTIEQERFEQVLECLRIRHQHYIEKVMPEMMASGLTDRKATLAEYKEKLSKPVYKGALQGAQQVRSEVNAYRESSLAMHHKLHSIAKKLFPKQGFVTVEL